MSNTVCLISIILILPLSVKIKIKMSTLKWYSSGTWVPLHKNSKWEEIHK